MNPALRPTAPMAPPPPQAGPQPPAPPTPPKPQQGLGGLQMGPPEDTLENALRRQSVAAMNIDPRVRQLEEEKRIEDRLKLTPAQRGVYEEGIAGLKGMYEKDFDPELQRREGIKRYLLGMGGRSMGEFAGGAGAAMDYDTSQREQKRARFKDLQTKREGLIGLERGAVSGGIEGGYKAAEQAGNTQLCVQGCPLAKVCTERKRHLKIMPRKMKLKNLKLAHKTPLLPRNVMQTILLN
jgi:hypothetical protein